MKEIETLINAHSHILLPESMDAELANFEEVEAPEHPLFI